MTYSDVLYDTTDLTPQQMHLNQSGSTLYTISKQSENSSQSSSIVITNSSAFDGKTNWTKKLTHLPFSGNAGIKSALCNKTQNQLIATNTSNAQQNTGELVLTLINQSGQIIVSKNWGSNVGTITPSSIFSDLLSHFYVLCDIEDSNGNKSFLVAKIDSSCNAVWVRHINNNNHTNSRKIISDKSNNLYVLGNYVSGGNNTPFVLKISDQGNIAWLKDIPYSGTSEFVDMVLSKDSLHIALAGHSQTNSFGDLDIIVALFDSSLNPIWSHYYGDNESDKAISIQNLPTGFVIAANTESYDNKTSKQLLLKIDSSGTLLWSKIYGLPRNASQFNENTLPLIIDLDHNIYTLSEETFQQKSAINISKLDNCGNTFCRFSEVLLETKTHNPANNSSSLSFNMGSTPSLTQIQSSIADLLLTDTSLCFTIDQPIDSTNDDTCIWEPDIEAIADCINTPAHFNDNTVIVLGQVFQRKWTWGDGNEALGGDQITYQYQEPGTYWVTLEIIGINSDNRICLGIDSIEVVIPNTLYVEYNKSHTICIGDSVTLDYERLSCWKLPLRALWSPNVGLSNINALEPTLATEESRWYFVELSDGNGLTYTDSVWVEVDSSCCRSRARFSTTKDIYCLSDSIEITNLSSALSNAQYIWDLDNPNISFFNGPFPPKIVYSTPGKYTLQLTLSDACSSDTFSKNIFIFENPQLDFKADSILCEPGHTFEIGGASIANNQYYWLNPEMADNDISNPTVTVNSDTQFIVRMQDYLTECYVYDTIRFEVIHLPKNFLGNDTTLCSNQTITIGSEIPADSSRWSNNTNFNQIEVQTPGGLFINSLFFSGCVASDTISIHFADLNEITFSLPNDTVLCDTEPFNIIPNGSVFNPLWNTGSTDSSITDIQGGLYVLSSSNEYCSYSDSISILRFSIEQPI